MTQTPYNQLPITIVNKAVRQKVYRQLHCYECGWPIADITDKVVICFDSNTPIEQLLPDSIGLVEIHCPRQNCKQYYRMEFSV